MRTPLLWGILFLFVASSVVAQEFPLEAEHEVQSGLEQGLTSETAEDGWRAPVHLQWREVYDARRYQVQLNTTPDFSEPPTLNLDVDSTKVTAQVPVGTYYMRVRHLRPDGAVSVWSKADTLQVRPPGPTPLTPDNSKIKRATPHSPFELAWQPIAGCGRYVLHIYRDEREIIRHLVKGTHARINKLESGEYTWNVACTVPVKLKSGRFPAGEKTTYEGVRSHPRTFQLNLEEEKVIPGPKLLWPKGLVSYHPEPLIFRWEAMPGKLNQVYHVHLYKEGEVRADKTIELNHDESLEEEAVEQKDDSEWKHLSSKTAKRDGVTPYRYLASKLPPGNYKWEVEVRDRGSKKVLGRSEEKFKVRKVGEFHAHEIYLGAGGGGAYSSYSSLYGKNEVAFVSQMSGVRAFGEYWFLKSTGLESHLQYGFGSYKDQGFSQLTFVTMAKYRMRLGGESSPWFATLRGGISVDVLPEILSESSTSIKRGSITRSGVIGGGSVSYGISERMSVSGNFLWNQTIRLSGGITDSAGITGNQTSSYRFGASFRGLWFWPIGIDIEAARVIDSYGYNAGDKDIAVSMGQYELRTLILYGF